MTALGADRATKRAGNQAKIINQRVELGTDIVYAGGMVGRLSTGLCVAAAATPGMRVLGVACETVDNSAGASGVYADIMRGAFWFANSASTDEILDDHLGEKCYVVDDNTVAAVGAAGRPVAGRVMAIDSTLGVLVEICGDEDSNASVGVLPAVVSADFILPVASVVNGAIYDIGTTAANSTVTLPASAPNCVIYFHADGTKNGHTITYRDATGPVSLNTATTASKRHVAVAVCLGGKWAVTVTVAP
jgi:hypothetical protein